MGWCWSSEAMGWYGAACFLFGVGWTWLYWRMHWRGR